METQPSKVFFSYSRDNSEFTLALAKKLRSNGIDLWLDQLDIPTGKRWDSEIEKALERCNTLVVMISPSSMSSNNVLDEVSYALEENKRVIPVVHKEAKLPFRLRRLQYIDLEEDYELGYQRILSLLKQETPQVAAASTTPVVTAPKPAPAPVKSAAPKSTAAATPPAKSKPNYLKWVLGIVAIIAIGAWGLSSLNNPSKPAITKKDNTPASIETPDIASPSNTEPQRTTTTPTNTNPQRTTSTPANTEPQRSSGLITLGDTQYKTIQLDGKTWLRQNLNYKLAGSWCYDDSESNCSKFGRLYTWQQAKAACNALGAGWHLPSTKEWASLFNSFGGGYSLSKTKNEGNPEVTYAEFKPGGRSGFNVLLGGWRSDKYQSIGRYTMFWSSNATTSGKSASQFGFSGSSEKAGKRSSPIGWGHSCRCVKN